VSDSSTQIIEKGYQLVQQGDLKGALKHFESHQQWVEAGKVAVRLDKPKKAIDLFLKGKQYAQVANVY